MTPGGTSGVRGGGEAIRTLSMMMPSLLGVVRHRVGALDSGSVTLET